MYVHHTSGASANGPAPAVGQIKFGPELHTFHGAQRSILARPLNACLPCPNGGSEGASDRCPGIPAAMCRGCDENNSDWRHAARQNSREDDCHRRGWPIRQRRGWSCCGFHLCEQARHGTRSHPEVLGGPSDAGAVLGTPGGDLGSVVRRRPASVLRSVLLRYLDSSALHLAPVQVVGFALSGHEREDGNPHMP